MTSLTDFCASSLLKDEYSFLRELGLNQVRLEKTVGAKYLTFPIFYKNLRWDFVYVIFPMFKTKFKHTLNI